MNDHVEAASLTCQFLDDWYSPLINAVEALWNFLVFHWFALLSWTSLQEKVVTNHSRHQGHIEFNIA